MYHTEYLLDATRSVHIFLSQVLLDDLGCIDNVVRIVPLHDSLGKCDLLTVGLNDDSLENLDGLPRLAWTRRRFFLVSDIRDFDMRKESLSWCPSPGSPPLACTPSGRNDFGHDGLFSGRRVFVVGFMYLE